MLIQTDVKWLTWSKLQSRLPELNRNDGWQWNFLSGIRVFGRMSLNYRLTLQSLLSASSCWNEIHMIGYYGLDDKPNTFGEMN